MTYVHSDSCFSLYSIEEKTSNKHLAEKQASVCCFCHTWAQARKPHSWMATVIPAQTSWCARSPTCFSVGSGSLSTRVSLLREEDTIHWPLGSSGLHAGLRDAVSPEAQLTGRYVKLPNLACLSFKTMDLEWIRQVFLLLGLQSSWKGKCSDWRKGFSLKRERN